MPLPTPPVQPAAARPSTARRLGRLALFLLAPATMLAALAVVPTAASANPAGPHDPIGKVEKITANANGSIHMVGWAADPDSTANVQLYGLTDGVWTRSGSTGIARAAIAKQYKTGPTPGFDISVPVPATGVHTVCLAVRNIGAGVGRVISCVVTPLGTRLTAQQVAAHSPRGATTSTTVSASSVRVRGWAFEPDFHGMPTVAVLYVDGQSVRTVSTGAASAAQRRAGAGQNGAFDISAPVSSGAHLACVWLVNVGLGSNTPLGCTAVDTRGAAGTATVKTPAVNTKVVTEAKKHMGQRYVWGAEGPKTFDCSGLVMYSYNKAGMQTPRVAAAQFAAARLIPAARAVPGDLVFYHDLTGDVYHVGIYLSPGLTVAAIDPQEGVANQTIWDPSTATYGSFTHT